MQNKNFSETNSQINFDKRKNCPACGSTKTSRIKQASFLERDFLFFFKRMYGSHHDFSFLSKGNYILESCNICSLVFQSEILNSDGMKHLYETLIDTDQSLLKNKNHESTYFRNIFEDILFISLFLTENTIPSQIRILDFGMGWGAWAKTARAFGFDIYGAELSKQRISHAEKNAIPIITNLESRNHSFRYINTEQVMEHIADLDHVMALIASNLSMGGYLRFSVPFSKKDIANVNSKGWKPAHDSLHPLEHINSFNRKSIIKLAGRFNLKPVPLGFFLKLFIKKPTFFPIILRRMISHFFRTNIILVKT